MARIGRRAETVPCPSGLMGRAVSRALSLALCLVLALGLVLAPVLALAPRPALAAGNLIVQDDAGLLTQEERGQLQVQLTGLSEYVDCAFVSTTEASRDVEDFAESYVRGHFGRDAAVIFVIDLYNRQVCVYANDEGRKVVSEGDARSITDNVYRYASDGDYYGCAKAAFAQILSRCQGGSVASPMRHVTNLLMAVVFGVLINFYVVYGSRARIIRRRASSQGMRSMAKLPEITSITPYMINQVRHYRRSGSGGGGGGGGGGGRSGGGSSHRF